MSHSLWGGERWKDLVPALKGSQAGAGEAEQTLQCGAVGPVTGEPGERWVQPPSQVGSHKEYPLSCALKDELGVLQAENGRRRVPQEGGTVCLGSSKM